MLLSGGPAVLVDVLTEQNLGHMRRTNFRTGVAFFAFFIRMTLPSRSVVRLARTTTFSADVDTHRAYEWTFPAAVT
jgi:hypothetical protein